MLEVTVAICTWNRSKLLQQTLQALTKLEIPADVNYSILVVNNNSTDDTASVCDSFVAQLPLRWVLESEPGLSCARNRVLREVQGGYVLWTDDDVVVDPLWLSEFVKTVRRFPTAAAFGGPVMPWFPVQPDPVLMDVFFWLRTGFCGLDHDIEEGPLRPGQSPFGANFALRMSAVGDLRFDTRLGPRPGAVGGGGDETEFLNSLQQAGGVVVWCPTSRVKHFVDPSRMTQRYLEGFAFEKGREAALVDVSFGRKKWLPLPRWMLWQFANVTFNYIISPLIPRTLPQRLSSGPLPDSHTPKSVRLTWRREFFYMRGFLSGVRERSSLELSHVQAGL